MAEEFRFTGKSEPFYNFAMNTWINRWTEYQILKKKVINVSEENVELVYELNNRLLE